MRAAPSSVLSSKPAVSKKFTGPIGKSSIDFSTTSVVVPAMSETIETSCPVILFNRVDFPTFVLPKNAICNLIDFNVFIILHFL